MNVQCRFCKIRTENTTLFLNGRVHTKCYITSMPDLSYFLKLQSCAFINTGTKGGKPYFGCNRNLVSRWLIQLMQHFKLQKHGILHFYLIHKEVLQCV